MRYKDEKVIPVSLRMKPPLKTKQAFEIANKASRAFLNEQIKETRKQKDEITTRIGVTQQKLESELTPNNFEHLSRICREAAEKMFIKIRENHVCKLEGLVRTKGPISPRLGGLDRWLINRTSIELTES